MNLCARVLTIVSLFTATASAQLGGMLPPVPVPPPPLVPNCPNQLLGQIDGLYYWQTTPCPMVDGVHGFGTTTQLYTPPCCNNATGECSCLVATAAKTPEAAPAPMAAIDSVLVSEACGLPQTTPAEVTAKLQAIITECKANRTYLQKLLASAEVEAGTDRTKGRVQLWVNTLSQHITFFEANQGGMMTPDKKIGHYCNTVVPMQMQHEQQWSVSVIAPSGATPSYVADEKQKQNPADIDPADVSFDAEAGVTVFEKGIHKVVITDGISGAPTEVFFKVFTFIKPAANGFPQGFTTVGVQVRDPGTGSVPTATFVDRHQFGHKIEIQYLGATDRALVSSWDNLQIAR